MSNIDPSTLDIPVPSDLDGIDRTILVVDDDPIIRRIVCAYLEAAGYQVEVCSDGHSAWEQIQSQPPAMLITDWNMPGMTGVELTGTVRASCEKHIYVLIATSRSTDDDAIQAIEAGADDFLAKPIEQSELLARVKRGMHALKRMEDEEVLSSKDPLTSAYNRRAFDRDCRNFIRRSRQNGDALSCVLLDIDFFKQINDTYGHSAGDEALCSAADAISKTIREDDRLYRYGGDEFCILLPQVDDDQMPERAQNIQDAISQITIEVDDRSFGLRSSAGVASLARRYSSAGTVGRHGRRSLAAGEELRSQSIQSL